MPPAQYHTTTRQQVQHGSPNQHTPMYKSTWNKNPSSLISYSWLCVSVGATQFYTHTSNYSLYYWQFCDSLITDVYNMPWCFVQIKCINTCICAHLNFTVCEWPQAASKQTSRLTIALHGFIQAQSPHKTILNVTVEIEDYSVAYFDRIAAFKVPYRWTSIKGRAHTRFVDSLHIRASTKHVHVWALPLIKVQWYDAWNAAMQSNYAMK